MNIRFGYSTRVSVCARQLPIVANGLKPLETASVRSGMPPRPFLRSLALAALDLLVLATASSAVRAVATTSSGEM